MSGNVWEWVSDWWGKNYYNNSPKNNPKGPSTSYTRVNRGGSWRFYPWDLRCADRPGYEPGLRHYYLGFRLSFSEDLLNEFLLNKRLLYYL